MGIPLSQLQTWSNRPDSATSASTYESVRDCLIKAKLPDRFQYSVYLQGSYANSTNIRADSDVDVVVELESTYRRTLERLSPDEKASYLKQAHPATTSLEDFRLAVKEALTSFYGSTYVEEGNKCLKVARNPNVNRLPIDVLPAQEHREYIEFAEWGRRSFNKGIYFETRDHRGVVNYPKLHQANGATKNQATNENFKPIVRLIKNARRKLAEDGKIDKGLSPSYFIECLVYNVPSHVFSDDLAKTYFDTLIWLASNSENFASFDCQNEMLKLFGPTPEQWNLVDAMRLVTALLEQWTRWNS
jgi:hypothetical protein